jgi:Peptidase C39 family
MMKIFLLIGFVIIIFSISLITNEPKNSTPLASPTQTIAKSAFHLPIIPIYLQNDPRWKNELIGGSQQTLGAVGCTVCCVSMALAHYGIDLPPPQLNELLKANNGYTSQGWLKWQTVSQLTHAQINFTIPAQPKTAVIDAALQLGQPIIAKILLYGIFPHWVLIVGKNGPDYLIKDPLGDGKSLTQFSHQNRIYAIRVVKNSNSLHKP